MFDTKKRVPVFSAERITCYFHIVMAHAEQLVLILPEHSRGILSKHLKLPINGTGIDHVLHGNAIFYFFRQSSMRGGKKPWEEQLFQRFYQGILTRVNDLRTNCFPPYYFSCRVEPGITVLPMTFIMLVQC